MTTLNNFSDFALATSQQNNTVGGCGRRRTRRTSCTSYYSYDRSTCYSYSDRTYSSYNYCNVDWSTCYNYASCEPVDTTPEPEIVIEERAPETASVAAA